MLARTQPDVLQPVTITVSCACAAVNCSANMPAPVVSGTSAIPRCANIARRSSETIPPSQAPQFIAVTRAVGRGQRAARVGTVTAPGELRELARGVRALIMTRGAEGSVIYTEGSTYEIPTVKAQAVVDPTGCGDAYRAGLIHGLLHGLDWRTTGHIASLMGAIKIEARGTQNHHFTRAAFQERLASVTAGAARLG